MGTQVNPKLQAVQDEAWDMKELCDELDTRRLYVTDEAALEAVLRDMRRIKPKLVALRDKYKRKPKGEPTGELTCHDR